MRYMKKREQHHIRRQGQPRSTNHTLRKVSAQISTSQVPPRPATNGLTDWKAYWKEMHQPWRTDPEISQERQRELKERLDNVHDIRGSTYPFKGMFEGMKLTRADIEWLLATHHRGLGPINESDIIDTESLGLDLSGVDLRDVSLRDLPLTGKHGSFSMRERMRVGEDQPKI